MRAMLVFIWGNYKPHLVMVMTKFCLAVSSILLQSILSTGISALVVVVYEHMISACILSALAFFFEKGTRPPFSFQILCYSFFLGFLLITVFQMLRTLSLQYIEATYQSVALNLMAAIVFVLALIFRQEDLQFCTIRGQAKMWGVGVSAAGALTMVLWAGPTLFESAFTASKSSSIIGESMLVVSILAGAIWNLLVGLMSKKYPAVLSLSAMMCFFGTIQAGIITLFLVTPSSWKLKWEGGLVLIAILWEGIMVTGLSYYAHVWCVHKKGPVFAAAFQPLLIVYTFLLEATVLREATHLGRVIGAVLVVLGLYMLLWGKAKDTEKQGLLETDETINSPLLD
ncbi:WAT1-related-like protein [Cinnamomum micranthum f. kanehirae]|uniref:WAT1-related protein n=1 Tax=Cinnamomum micranthum f. kanehirae TaxID=337451 RepID=A0A3S3NNV3_9MAGN|nr:WAT1-related-like protein [Cinnamomum micranthum f. kanehirae]